MKLRLQLILVSSLTLILPWGGCVYLKEMEGVLRANQQVMLLSTAQSVATALEKRPDRLQITEPDSKQAARIYLTEATHRYSPDGYPDEWNLEDSNLQKLSANGQDVYYSAAVYNDTVWLFFKIPGDSNNWHNPAGPGYANGDRIKLVTKDKRREVYWISPQGPGEFTAFKRVANRSVPQASIFGALLGTDDGYQVELQIPLDKVGHSLGFEVKTNKKIVSSIDSAGQPGLLIRQDDTLSAMLGNFAGDKLRLTLVDSNGYILATAGQLEFRDEARQDLPPGAWLLEVFYRLAMPGNADTEIFQPPENGRIVRKEVAAALEENTEQSTWYSSGREPPSAIISAALPLKTPWLGGAGQLALIAEQSSDQLLSLNNAAMTRLLGISLATMLIIIGALLGYASFLSIRIRRLNQAISNVMQDDGSINEAFPQRWGNDELGELGSRFASLLTQVLEYTEYLRTLASKLSHELRTPLALVRSSLENYADNPDPAYLERAATGSQRLSRILTAMSEANRVEQAIKSADLETIDLSGFISSYMRSYAAVQSDITFVTEVPDVPCNITGSADLLAQMLDKLLDNAVDFQTADTSILVRLSCQRKRAIISVENTGELLPGAMNKQLFESMVSIREKSDASGTHLGLGLTIVRLIAEYHAGTATAENLQDNSGVRFSIVIPVSEN